MDDYAKCAERAQELAGDNLPLLQDFARALVENGEKLGLIGPLELPRLWLRHLINSALLAPLVRAGGVVADIGTGGGFPGLVLAICCPGSEFKFVEPMERRCIWLQDQITALGLENATVCRGRAEEFAGEIQADQVTARAVTALKKLVPITAPLLKPGGEMLFLKGQNVDAEITAAAKQIQKLKLKNVRVEILGEKEAEKTRVFRAELPG